jgi:hypothetical protein
MSDIPDEIMDEEELGTELEAGREPPPWSQAPDWVHLSEASPTAKELHTILSAHINQKRAGKRVVWPSTRSLAKMLGLPRRDKVSPFIAELVKLQAIDKARRGMPARNVYVVHQMPPEGYDGPLSVADWYERNRDALAAEAAIDKDIRDNRKAAKKKDAAGQKKQQVTPVTPDTGQLGDGAPVTPDTGQLVAPDTGQLVTPPAGREQEEVELDEVEPEQGVDQKPPAGAAGDADAKIAQTTIDGTEEPLGEALPNPKDVAKGIARVWIEYWAHPKRNSPIGGAAERVLHARMTSCVLGFLTRDYTQDEIGKALNLIAEPVIPTTDRLQRALGEVRGVRPPAGRGGPRQARRTGANVEREWSDVRPAGGKSSSNGDAKAAFATASTGGASEW